MRIRNNVLLIGLLILIVIIGIVNAKSSPSDPVPEMSKEKIKDAVISDSAPLNIQTLANFVSTLNDNERSEIWRGLKGKGNELKRKSEILEYLRERGEKEKLNNLYKEHINDNNKDFQLSEIKGLENADKLKLTDKGLEITKGSKKYLMPDKNLPNNLKSMIFTRNINSNIKNEFGIFYKDKNYIRGFINQDGAYIQKGEDDGWEVHGYKDRGGKDRVLPLSFKKGKRGVFQVGNPNGFNTDINFWGGASASVENRLFAPDSTDDSAKVKSSGLYWGYVNILGEGKFQMRGILETKDDNGKIISASIKGTNTAGVVLGNANAGGLIDYVRVNNQGTGDRRMVEFRGNKLHASVKALKKGENLYTNVNGRVVSSKELYYRAGQIYTTRNSYDAAVRSATGAGRVSSSEIPTVSGPTSSTTGVSIGGDDYSDVSEPLGEAENERHSRAALQAQKYLAANLIPVKVAGSSENPQIDGYNYKGLVSGNPIFEKNGESYRLLQRTHRVLNNPDCPNCGSREVKSFALLNIRSRE